MSPCPCSNLTKGLLEILTVRPSMSHPPVSMHGSSSQNKGVPPVTHITTLMGL